MSLSSSPRRHQLERLSDDELNALMRMVYLLNQAEGNYIPPPPYIRPRRGIMASVRRWRRRRGERSGQG